MVETRAHVVVEAGPHRGAAGGVGERGEHAAVERGPHRIADELVAEGHLEPREALADLGELDAEVAVEGDELLHHLTQDFGGHGGSHAGATYCMLDPVVLSVREDDEALRAAHLLHGAGIALSVRPRDGDA